MYLHLLAKAALAHEMFLTIVGESVTFDGLFEGVLVGVDVGVCIRVKHQGGNEVSEYREKASTQTRKPQREDLSFLQT